MMSEQQFDARLARINEQYEAHKEGAVATRDQEVARLFHECEWTQERIAGRMGKRQVWVSQRLCFGRFLDFIASGDKRESVLNLTERRFRGYWKRTKGKENARFEQVLHALEHGIPHGRAALVSKPGVREALLGTLADGKWYTVSQVTATVEESLPGVTEEQVTAGVGHTRRNPPDGQRIEVKKIGRKCQYRLVSGSAAGGPEAPAKGLEEVISLYEEARPLIEELRHWGKSSKWHQCPGELLKLAVKLERLFESRLPAEPARPRRSGRTGSVSHSPSRAGTEATTEVG